MQGTAFDRDAMARWYATRHLKTDPGIRSVYYLPKQAPDREIRLLEVNDLIATRIEDPLEPLDFGVHVDTLDAHQLLVVDVTPTQWEDVRARRLQLPPSWVLDDAQVFSRQSG